MTSLQRSITYVLVFALSSCSPVLAQGTQGGSGQPAPPPVPAMQPPVTMPAPPPAPAPVVIPQSTEGGNGETPSGAKSNSTPPPAPAPVPAHANSAVQDSAPVAEKVSLAGCILADHGNYELIQPSGNRLFLMGKTNNLQVGSAVELHGFVQYPHSGALAKKQGLTAGYGLFSVTSDSLLSHSCAFTGALTTGIGGMRGTGIGGLLGAISGPGSQGTAGEPPSSKKSTSLALTSPPQSSQSTHLQSALTALKTAEQELIAAKAQPGSQGDLALQTIHVAIGNLELAAKQQK
jgi:hypothetical protein